MSQGPSQVVQHATRSDLPEEELGLAAPGAPPSGEEAAIGTERGRIRVPGALEPPGFTAFHHVPEEKRPPMVEAWNQGAVAAVRAEGEGMAGDGEQIRAAQPVDVGPFEAAEVLLLESVRPRAVPPQQLPDA